MERRIVLVSERQLLRRVNRVLVRRHQWLLRNRFKQRREALGRFFGYDLHLETVVAVHVSLERTARGLQVLCPWERLGTRREIAAQRAVTKHFAAGKTAANAAVAATKVALVVQLDEGAEQ